MSRLFLKTLLALSLGLAIPACDEATSDPPKELNGKFLTRGYGYALDSDGTNATIYEVTALSCIAVATHPVVGMTIPALDLAARFAGETLLIHDAGTMAISADRVRALPAACNNGGTQPTNDPLVNFDIASASFAEQYAFFELRGVDWLKHSTAFRGKLSPESTRGELFQVLCDMVQVLADGHVGISDGSNYCPGKPPAPDLSDNLEGLTNYFQNALWSGPGVSTDAGGALAHRMLAPGVGYLGLSQMFLENTATKDQAGEYGQAIDRALAALGDPAQLIIDVRANPGGLDAVSLAIAGRFTDVPLVAYTKKARYGKSHTAEQTVRVIPLGPKAYQGKVVLLTSRYTGSAAETFSLMMKVNPHVTILGENTSGAFSDVLSRQLPNDMSLGLSNEIYRAADGHIYEGVGVPPTVFFPMAAAELATGRDALLDAALALAAK